MMDMVCSLVLQTHDSDKLHNHYSFVIVADGQLSLTISKLKSNELPCVSM